MQRPIHTLLSGVAISFFFFSCSLFTVKTNSEPIVRVYDKFLSKSDIELLVPPGTSEEDSTVMVQAYIAKWVEQNIILHYAELNLAFEKKNMEKQLEDYRNSLLIYTYEKELIEQKLDTLVTDSEIEEYYQKNKHNFELKDYIVKVMYIKLENKSPQLEKVKKWFKSGKEEDIKSLEEYSRKYAVNFFFDTQVWLYFDDIIKEIPIETINKEEFLKRNKYVEYSDETQLYLLSILDYKLKDDISPLSLEKENIRNIILNQRKLKFISNMKKDLFQDAISKNNIEYYIKEGNEKAN